jgi:glycosyltransferase involved in cell wall biosynthesis
MKILFADQFSEMGGAQTCLTELLEEVLHRGWQAEVIAPGSGPLHEECAKRGIPSSSLPLARYASGHKTSTDILRYGFDSVRAGLAIRKAARRFNADLIYVNGPRALPAAVLGAAATPIVFHAHSYPDREYARRITRWCVSRKKMTVLAISQFAARPFAGLDESRLRIIYNGVSDHGFLARPRTEPQCIGIIGRISHEKGQRDFVRAAGMMTAARPNLRFVIFGAALFADGVYESEVRAAAQGLPVEFRGWTDDVSGALREIDILAVPSGPAEGATRVIMEAFSAGTPVVAYPSGGIPELIRHRETGLLTRERRAEDLALSLTELLNDPELMHRLSTQGRQEWESRFQLPRWQREICDFIQTPGRTDTIAARSEQPAPASADGAERAAL